VNKTSALFLLKASITAACLGWLSRYIDFEQLRSALGDIDVRLLIVAIALHFLSFVAGGVRWWLLFRHLHGDIPFRRIWPSYYLGAFFNNLLPSLFGGDLARTARLYASGLGGGALIGSAIIDRLLGLAAVVSMGLAALLFAPPGFERHLGLSIFGPGMLALLAMAAIALVPRWAKPLDAGYGSRWPQLHAALSGFPRCLGDFGLVLKAFGLSVLNQLLVVLAILLLAPGLGVHLPVFQFMVVLMLVFLASSLPISLGGLGAREATMMTLLLPLGVDPSAVVALSAAYLLVLWSSTLPGAFMLLRREPRAREAAGR